MKKIIILTVFFLSSALTAYAVAPLALVAVTTAAGTSSVSAAATSAVGLTITALALAKSVFFPTNIKFPTQPSTQGFLQPLRFDSNSSYSNSCALSGTRAYILGTPPPDLSGTYSIANVPCNSPSYAQSLYVTSGCTTDSAPLCVKYIVHYTLRCLSSSCGTLANGQSASWAGAEAYEANLRIIHEGTSPNEVLHIDRKDNVLSYRANDKDIPLTVGGESGFPALTTDGGLALQTLNSNQKDTVVTIKPAPLGTSIAEYTQTTPTEYQKAEIEIDTASVIRSGKITTATGTLNPVPVSDPLVSINYSPVTSTDPGTNPGTNTGQTTVTNFPSDYARAGEAAIAAQSVVEAVQNITAGDVVTPTVEVVPMPWFGSTFDGVLPSITTVGATCPVWQFDALGESFYIDHHCQLIMEFNSLFYAMFTAFWVLLGFRTVMEA